MNLSLEEKNHLLDLLERQVHQLEGVKERMHVPNPVLEEKLSAYNSIIAKLYEGGDK